MGFFDNPFKEIARPFEKIGKQAKRSLRDLDEELRRVDKDLSQILGLSPPPVPGIPPAALPAPPVGIPETGGGEVTKKRRLILGGRGRTILAGQLTPTTRKRILG